MAENEEHPKRLWIVEEDVSAGFAVREADVEPVYPERPPDLWTRYRILGEPEWHTASLDFDAFRTKVEALNQAVSNAYDAVEEWKRKRLGLEDLLSQAEDEAAAEQEEDEERTDE